LQRLDLNYVDGSVEEIGGSESDTTNNKMELVAVEQTIRFADGMPSIIYTDSAYVANNIHHLEAWKSNNWMTRSKTPVANKEVWQKISLLPRDNVTFYRLPGHANILGNERADKIATQFADTGNADLKKMSLDQYGEGVLKVSVENIKKGKEKSNKGKAYSYVSVVDGKVETHATWQECEARVKGRNAKFKKVFSESEEKDLIAEYKKP
jgi:ribonuclease HI